MTDRTWRVAFFALVLALTILRAILHPRLFAAGPWRWWVFLLTWIGCLGIYAAVFARTSTGVWRKFDVVAVTGIAAMIAFEALWPGGTQMLRPAHVAGAIASACLGSALGYSPRGRDHVTADEP